jgi:hypothetical protein
MLVAMDADENEIVAYLKQFGRQFVSSREICRRAAGKQRYREEPYWANQPLLRLVERAILETDSAGHFRMVPDEKDQRSHQEEKAQHAKKLFEEAGADISDALCSEVPDTSASQNV